ncbi:hypothetical protein K7G98_12550 [Saccharothrix sp. MB29]|nr:hypothetical protein [Saccharothrix sp. MB29]
MSLPSAPVNGWSQYWAGAPSSIAGIGGGVGPVVSSAGAVVVAAVAVVVAVVVVTVLARAGAVTAVEQPVARASSATTTAILMIEFARPGDPLRVLSQPAVPGRPGSGEVPRT